MVDLKKAVEAAKYGAIALIAIDILQYFVVNFANIPILKQYFWIPIDILNIIIFLYIGFNATRSLKADILTAGLSGAIAALASGIAFTIMGLVISGYFLNTGGVNIPPELLKSFGGTTGAWGVLLGIVFIIEVMITLVSIVVNFILASIGGLIGQRLK